MNRTLSLTTRLGSLRRNPIASNVLTLLSGSVIGQACLAVATLLTARLLGHETFGQYAACFALGSLTSTAFTFGMDGWLLQQGRATGLELDEQMSNSLLIRALLGLPWFLALGLLAPRLNPSAYPDTLIWFVAATLWLDGLLAACLSAFKAALQNHLTSLLVAASAGGLLGATLLLLAAGVEDVRTFAAVRGLVSLLLLAGTLATLHTRGRLRPRWQTLAPILPASAPFALSELLFLVYLKADLAIVAAQLGKEATGLYAPASSVIGALFLVPSALYMVMVPVLSRVLAETNSSTPEVRHAAYRRLSVLLRHLTLAVVAIGVALTLGTALVAHPLTHLLLGHDYALTGTLLQILSPLLLFKAGSYGAAALLVAGGWQAQRVQVQALVALLNAALNLLLVQQVGLVGVAWIYVLTEALLCLGYTLLARKRLRGKNANTP